MLYQISNPAVYFPLWWFFWPIWSWFCISRDQWIIQDMASETVLYSTKHESYVYPAEKTWLYNGEWESGDCIATIECFSLEASLIQMNKTGEYILFHSERWWDDQCFDYDDEELCWSNMRLTNATGVTLAQLKTSFSSWSGIKIAQFIIIDMTEEKRRVVLATMIAMDWREKLRIIAEKRRRREEEERGWRKEEKTVKWQELKNMERAEEEQRQKTFARCKRWVAGWLVW